MVFGLVLTQTWSYFSKLLLKRLTSQEDRPFQLDNSFVQCHDGSVNQIEFLFIHDNETFLLVNELIRNISQDLFAVQLYAIVIYIFTAFQCNLN